ncbi:MAG: hypothetical protein R3B70_07760 [Polyangiaceae bacterium]
MRPGESSLFWDWTRTRDSAPEAEDVRPSGEGEVLVSDKEAAAAYVPPVEVAPAVAPRGGTKSRIRVRPDVDPRRQPTVKTSHRGRRIRSWGAGRGCGSAPPPSGRRPRSAGSLAPFLGIADRLQGARTRCHRPARADRGGERASGGGSAWAVPVGLLVALGAFVGLLPGAARRKTEGAAESERRGGGARERRRASRRAPTRAWTGRRRPSSGPAATDEGG